MLIMFTVPTKSVLNIVVQLFYLTYLKGVCALSSICFQHVRW